MTRIAFLLISFFAVASFANDTTYVSVKAKAGETITHLLKTYRIQEACNTEQFYKKNLITENGFLVADRTYDLPVLIYKYNNVSIRSTTQHYDYQLALRIQDYNDALFKAGIKPKDFRIDHELWVPYSYLHCDSELMYQSDKDTQVFPIFGEQYQNITFKDEYLKGHVYYLVSGHGGPDPGAMGDYKDTKLCEDEYAYDVTLRLAKNLIEHGATVYLIIRDDNDGIRDEAVLPGDHDERCWPNQKIPLNQVTRLQQRVQVINELYLKHKKSGALVQKAIIIHVDSRSTKSRVDIFFYHYPGSKKGKEFAISLHETVKENYAKYRKGRGYGGQIKDRELYILKYSFPTAVFIELGNIRNPDDQKRIVSPKNRQIIADWLTEGVLKEK
jgi:N-acetylmuramoyl-L-alanine amidase